MEIECKTCSKKFNKVPSQIKRTKNHFCSSSCAATYNNKKYPKRKKQPTNRNCAVCNEMIPKRNKYCENCRVTGPPKLQKTIDKENKIKICLVCNDPIPKTSNRLRYCNQCAATKKVYKGIKNHDDIKKRKFTHNPTLMEVYNSKGFKTNSWANVRYRARAKIEKLNITQCQHPDCTYDKHVQVCHKRAISDFPLDTPLSVVNSLDNLIVLCPNHHWEFDHPS